MESLNLSGTPRPRHNLKPHAVAAILAVLAEKPAQTFLALRAGPGCYCLEGVVCEAYRRATGLGEWMPIGVGGERFRDGSGLARNCAGEEVKLWATGRLSMHMRLDVLTPEKRLALCRTAPGFWNALGNEPVGLAAANDFGRMTFDEFRTLLEGS